MLNRSCALSLPLVTISAFTFLAVTFLITSSALAAEPKPLFYCRAGFYNQEKTKFAVLTTEKKTAELQFGQGISSRLAVQKSGALGIEVLHGLKVVSTMAVKPDTFQFAMSAGGIEMGCWPGRGDYPY